MKRALLKSAVCALVAELIALAFLLAVFAVEARLPENPSIPMASVLARLLNSLGLLVAWFAPTGAVMENILFFVVNWLCWWFVCVLLFAGRYCCRRFGAGEARQ